MKHSPITTWPRGATILGPNNVLGLQARKKASNVEQPSCQAKKQMGSSQSYTDCLSQVLSQPILKMGKHSAGAR